MTRPICTIDADARPRRITLCPGLSQLVGRSHGGRGGGIKIESRINMQTMELTRELVVLRSGDHQKNGMVLNFCPICGADLSPLFADLIAEDVA